MAGDETVSLEDLEGLSQHLLADAVVYNDLPAAEYVALLTRFGIPERGSLTGNVHAVGSRTAHELLRQCGATAAAVAATTGFSSAPLITQ